MLPMNLENARKLHAKGFITDAHMKKIDGMHKEFNKAQKMACGGNVKYMADGGEVEAEPTVDQAEEKASPELNTSRDAALVKQLIADQGEARGYGDAPGVARMSFNRDVVPAIAAGPAQDPEAKFELPATAGGAKLPAMQSDFNPEQPPEKVPASIGALAGDRQSIEVNPNLQQPVNPYDKAFLMQLQGEKELADAASKRGEMVAKGYDAAAKVQEDRADAADKLASDNQEKAQKKAQQYFDEIDKASQMKVDPNRMWSEKSTGDKILAGIGLFFGAFGQTGGNTAATVIQNAIDRDIKAQEFDIKNKQEGIANKGGLLRQMYDINKDMYSAKLATNIAYDKAMMQKVDSIAARYSGPEAQAKAKMAMGMIGQNMAAKEQELAMYQMKRQAMGGDPSMKEYLDKDQRERLPGDPAYTGFANSPEEATKFREKSVAVRNTQGIIKELQQIANTPGAAADPAMRARAQTLSTSLAGELAKETFGRVSQNEYEKSQDMARDPTHLWSLKDSNMAALNTLYEQSQKHLDNQALVAGYKPVSSRYNIQKTGTTIPKGLGAK